MLIGISGKIGAGKDTVADMMKGWFVANDSVFYIIKRLADPLKQIAATMLGRPQIDMEDREFKESRMGEEWSVHRGPNLLKGPKGKYAEYESISTPLTVREFMIRIGEGMRTSVHPDIWINSLFRTYTADSNWIVPDVRYPNEAERILALGGIVIRVNRPDNPFPALNSDSETSLDHFKKFNAVLENTTIEYLQEQVKELLNKHGNKSSKHLSR